MEEMFDTYDINGNFLGIKPKSFCHSENPGVYHKPVWIWILNSNNQVLLQKRAANKKFMPNLWDAPSAGHVCAGESFIEACQRETEEELGLSFEQDRFKFQKEVLSQKVWELGQVYLLKADFDITEAKLQKEEVAEIQWYEFNDFKNILYSNNFMPYDIEYKDWVCDMLSNNFVSEHDELTIE